MDFHFTTFSNVRSTILTHGYYDVQMQFVIYNEIKEKFGDHLWLDVVSKCDLLQESPVRFATDNGDDTDLNLERYRKFGPDGAIHVSVKNEVGLMEVIFIIIFYSPLWS